MSTESCRSATGMDELLPEVASVPELESIWDCEKIEKGNDDKGKPKWTCLHCFSSFFGWNSTKAVAHVTRTRNMDIKICAGKMELVKKVQYQKLLDVIVSRRLRKRVSKDMMDTVNTQHNNKNASALENSKFRKKHKNVPDAIEILDDGETLRSSSKISAETSLTPSSNTTGNSSRKSFLQTTLYNAPNPTADSKLTMAIADMIHACGLPFALAQHPKFRLIINLARCTGTNYSPPSRNSVAGELLDLNYCQYQENATELLLRDLDTFGLSFYGDGATVKRMPLFNLLCSGVHLTTSVLEIVDCSAHMATGGKKDARYICSLFRPYIDRFETLNPNCCDLLLFDGASNVQKAGEVIAGTYPRAYIVHGAEHVMSLFYQDIFGNPILQAMSTITKRTYNTFGSGARHAPYAMFQKNSKEQNNGKNIGLVRAAGTRMGGEPIAMMRLIRVKDPIIQTVCSAEFTRLKVSSHLSFITLLYLQAYQFYSL